MQVPTRIEVQKGERVLLSWSDGSETILGARQLRAACQCASCREPGGRRATEAVLQGDRPIEVLEAHLVGAYAINFVFGPDGHHTGIYPFDRLRDLSSDEGWQAGHQ